MSSTQDFIDRLNVLRKSTIPYSEWQKNHFPEVVDSYAGMNNGIVVVIDLLSYYKDIWQQILVPKDDANEDSRVKQGRNSIFYITKWLFGELIGAMEYNTKMILLKAGNSKFDKFVQKINNEQEVYLSDVMKSAKDKNILSENEYKKWATVFKLRGLLSHVGGISNIDVTMDFGDGLVIKLEKGQQVKGTVDFFISLLEKSLPMYFEWVKLILNKPQQ